MRKWYAEGYCGKIVAVRKYSMPKITEFPKLRAHAWRDRTYHYYDRRTEGLPDIALGPDFGVAVELWRRIRDGEEVQPFCKPKKVQKLRPKVRAERRPPNSSQWVGIPDWARSAYTSAERRSRERGRTEMMTVAELSDVVRRADGRCEFTGLPLDVEGSGRRPFAPSLDRIDSRIGYVAGNVRIVCLMVNQAMSEWGEAPVLQMAAALLRK